MIDDFLASDDSVRPWQLPDGFAAVFDAELLALGGGDLPLEVALAKWRARGRPRAPDVRSLWRARHGNRANPLLLVVAWDGADAAATQAVMCGPLGADPPMTAAVSVSQAERIAAAALAEPTRHAAARFLAAALPEADSDLPGIRNAGMFATQELREGVPTRADWAAACEQGRRHLGQSGRDLVEALGFSVESHGTTTSVLRIAGAKRAVAVFLDDREGFEEAAQRFGGTSPVSQALAVADQESLPWVVLTRGRQMRVYAARAETGVGRKGRAETFVEANLALLADHQAGYLPLLFGAQALREGGTFDEILDSSRDFAAALGARLRDRVYRELVPDLALAIARHQSGGGSVEAVDLDSVYEQTLTVLFRLLFVAYAEDKDLLPYRSNGRYRDHALKTLARRLADQHAEDEVAFDQFSTDLWDDVRGLWAAVDRGNTEWGIPAYNGGLFSNDPGINTAGAALTALSLTNAEFGPALSALLVDAAEGGEVGPIDFRSLSVREFGTIYEGLLESNLAIAPSDLTLDAADHFIPVGAGDEVVVASGEIFFHNRSGERKATGSYFTKPFAVEHLLAAALEPALGAHLERLEELTSAGDEHAASEAFFDFRCVDIAMGSAHFLIAAVDRIEAGLSAFLALNPLPAVSAELTRLRVAAVEALGELGDSVEIEHASLLRRQVARRCIYGVDRNPIAVELARLSMWVHTFVPGLPLSFLDHSLVCGDSLAGIGTIDEAVSALDPQKHAGWMSVFRQEIDEFLGRAGDALRRLARTVDATAAEISDARDAHASALEAVAPARRLFDLIVAARLTRTAEQRDRIDLPSKLDEESITTHMHGERATQIAAEVRALHFPVAFPEVFLRDRPGFDCVLGNPPWEEATVEELAFWALRYPGLRSQTQAHQRARISALRVARPDLHAEYQQAVIDAERLRALLLAGPYPGMGTGDPDLYKAFTWRFWYLVRDDGAIGVVLPRAALALLGSAPWREAVLDGGTYSDATLLLNNRKWVFDEVHPQYTIGLISIRKGTHYAREIRLRGPFASLRRYDEGMRRAPVTRSINEFRGWSEGAAFPLLPSEESLTVFLKLRAHPRLDSPRQPWTAKPVAELHATNDKKQMILNADDTSGLWPVYKGASFDLWQPSTGDIYAWADPDHITSFLQAKRLRQQRTSSSAFNMLPREAVIDAATLPCRSPRVAFRGITNRTNRRTVIAALVPPDVVITNKGPYLLWKCRDPRDEAFVLGVLSSIPLDWYARRWVEVDLTFNIFNAFPIPTASSANPLRRRIEEIAGTLAAVDARYADWADAVGVPIGDTDDGTRMDLVAELDATVALLFGLGRDDVEQIFETFHVGWDYTDRLSRVLVHLGQLEDAHAEAVTRQRRIAEGAV